MFIKFLLTEDLSAGVRKTLECFPNTCGREGRRNGRKEEGRRKEGGRDISYGLGTSL